MKNKSVWLDYESIDCEELRGNLDLDVLIVGGGIAGISTLYQLRNSNLKVALIERNKCGHGVTSKSTAKINYLQDILVDIIKINGKDVAKKYLDSQIDASLLLKNIIIKEKINCDLKQVSSYLFTKDEKKVSDLDLVYDLLKDNNINVLDSLEVPNIKNVIKSIKVLDTYVFHPLKYIDFMKKKFKSKIFENSKLDSLEKVKDYYLCNVNGYIIKTKYIVFCTHYPYFLKPFLMPLKGYIESSYIGCKINNEDKDINALSIDNPCISYRYHKDNKWSYFIYLENSKIASDVKNIKDNFDKLKSKDNFNYYWSNKDIMTNDFLPYIGTLGNNMLLATGFNTWGISNGTIAGLILADIIEKRDNKYIELFKPYRKMRIKSIKNLLLDVYGSGKALLISGKSNVNNKNVIYKKIDGQNVIIYKDKNNKEHIVLNRCPHMKCGLILNEKELTWECMCHGSKFDIDGKCIEGPSNYNIEFKKQD